MRTLLLLVLIVAAVVVVVVVVRARAAAAGPPAAPAPRQDPLRAKPGIVDPRSLKVGDVVSYAGADFVIRGTLRFDQDGFQWQEHLLDDANKRRWLSVEDDEELEVVLWESLTAPELQPGAPTLEHAGVRYSLSEHATARFTAEGTTGTAPSGPFEYYDYAQGEQALSFERYGSGGWEVGVGTEIDGDALDIYPVTS